MSARRTIPDLAVRRRIGHMLPALFHDDELAQRWCSGLDAVVAPVPTTIDNFGAYLDPLLAPIDFVEWLSTWVGLELDQTWTEPRRRELVASAYRLHDARGTAKGLADLIELYTGTRPEVTDGGGVRWSATPDADLPGDDDAELVVRLRVPDASSVDADRLETMVALAKPAHVPHRIEIDIDPDLDIDPDTATDTDAGTDTDARTDTDAGTDLDLDLDLDLDVDLEELPSDADGQAGAEPVGDTAPDDTETGADDESTDGDDAPPAPNDRTDEDEA